MIHCVTTMNEDYYHRIGKFMLHTWAEFFPENYVLHVYLENFKVDLDKKIIQENWVEVQELFDAWELSNPESNNTDKRFTKKALTQISSWNKIKTGKLFWLDADIIFLKKIPVNLFDLIIEDYPLASWGEEQFESGTVFINLDHKNFLDIKNWYEDIYLFKKLLPIGQRWFDGELLGWACVQAGKKHRNLKSLCDAKTSTPMNRSWIGEFMQHFKAKRKNQIKEELINYYKRSDIANVL